MVCSAVNVPFIMVKELRKNGNDPETYSVHESKFGQTNFARISIFWVSMFRSPFLLLVQIVCVAYLRHIYAKFAKFNQRNEDESHFLNKDTISANIDLTPLVIWIGVLNVVSTLPNAVVYLVTLVFDVDLDYKRLLIASTNTVSIVGQIFQVVLYYLFNTEFRNVSKKLFRF